MLDSLLHTEYFKLIVIEPLPALLSRSLDTRHFTILKNTELFYVIDDIDGIAYNFTEDCIDFRCSNIGFCFYHCPQYISDLGNLIPYPIISSDVPNGKTWRDYVKVIPQYGETN